MSNPPGTAVETAGAESGVYKNALGPGVASANVNVGIATEDGHVLLSCAAVTGNPSASVKVTLIRSLPSSCSVHATEAPTAFFVAIENSPFEFF
jgi:hypothetical protein